MKKILFLLLIITIFSGCEIEHRLYVHRHPWSRSYRAHKYYVPRSYRIYEAPSKSYRKRGF
jgi:hypothetical protein